MGENTIKLKTCRLDASAMLHNYFPYMHMAIEASWNLSPCMGNHKKTISQLIFLDVEEKFKNKLSNTCSDWFTMKFTKYEATVLIEALQKIPLQENAEYSNRTILSWINILKNQL